MLLILIFCLADAGNIEGLFSDSSQKETFGRRGKKGTKSKPASTDEAHVAVGGKDASLFLFRALGKVLYCKSKLKIVSTHTKHIDPITNVSITAVKEGICQDALNDSDAVARRQKSMNQGKKVMNCLE